MEAPSIQPGQNRLSIDEYADLPDDGKRYEIIDGVLHVTPAPAPRHQRISRNLETLLIRALQDTGQGEVFDAPIDVVLDRHTVVQPDILFIRSERLGIIGEKNIEGPPDLVIEILSPSTRRTDVLLKGTTYARFGVASYWIVDPDLDRVELYRLDPSTASYTLAAMVSSPAVAAPEELPGLSIPLAEVFPPQTPRR
jgi:Uma2 family endonuclease